MIVLWVDSFTDGMSPDVATAAVEVLERAGYTVIVPPEQSCCGLTWITTGQLTAARDRLRRLLDILEPYASQGFPIVGLEPSCTAVLRSDLADLLPEDSRSDVVSQATVTLAELLSRDEAWQPPDLAGLELIVQPHCHHHSVMGFGLDERLLRATGGSVRTISGCCGLAGNFGMERGHYEMSVAIAEHALVPALRGRPATSVVVADGFSCRTQIEQLTGVPSMHLSQLLAGGRHPQADLPH